MTDSKMEQVLIEALDLLESGHSVDEILQRFNAEADDLRAYLLTAEQLMTVALQPFVAAKQQSQQAMLRAAAGATERPGRQQPAWWARRAFATVMVTALVVFFGAGTMLASAGQALPGDALYGTKQWAEQAQLALTADPEDQARLRESFRQRRVAEAAALLALGRDETVTFTGPIEAIAGDDWRVDGIPVRLTGGSVIDGVAAVGRLVEVVGRSAAGVVTADRITVLDGLPPQTDALPAPSPTDRPATVVPSATTPPTPTSASAATPTASATAAPTVTPADDDANANQGDDSGNANDDDDDGGNSNDDDNGNDNDDAGTSNGNDNDDAGNSNDDDNDNDDDGGGNDNDDGNDNGDDGNDNGDNDNDNEGDDNDGED